jgi:hypothetical protein
LPPLPREPDFFSVDRFYFLLKRNLDDAAKEETEMKNLALMYEEIMKLFKHFGGLHTHAYYDLKDFSK